MPNPTKVPIQKQHDAAAVDARARQLLALGDKRTPAEAAEFDHVRSLRKRMLAALRAQPTLSDADKAAVKILKAPIR